MVQTRSKTSAYRERLLAPMLPDLKYMYKTNPSLIIFYTDF